MQTTSRYASRTSASLGEGYSFIALRFGTCNCDISLDSVTGTYCGKLPSNVETTLTLNADETYLLIRKFKEKQNEWEKLRGTFQVLEGNILMLVHPLSGDNIFYKVRDANHIILIDSFGYEPPIEERKNYILRKER